MQLQKKIHTSIVVLVGACLVAIISYSLFAFLPTPTLGQTTVSEVERSIQQKEQEIVILQQQLKSLRETLAKIQQSAQTQSSSNTSTGGASVVLIRQYQNFTQDLGISSTGEEVKNLQLILNELGYYPDAIFSGYFGSLSQAAVQKFQAARGVVSSGSPESTGYGFVGPATRRALNAIISGAETPGIVSSTPSGNSSGGTGSGSTVTSSGVTSAVGNYTTSYYAGQVKLRRANATNEKPADEYIEVYMDTKATSDIILNGWTIKSTVTNRTVTLSNISQLFRFGRAGSAEELRMSPKNKLTIVTGASPITQNSFRANKCSGYLLQFYTFKPSFSSSCPRPEDEFKAYGKIPVTDDSCYDYVRRISSCKVPQAKDIPTTISLACRYFVESNLNYNSCLDTHLKDADFWKDDWRLYLNRSEELWRKTREELVLLDQYGNLVDSVNY